MVGFRVLGVTAYFSRDHKGIMLVTIWTPTFIPEEPH